MIPANFTENLKNKGNEPVNLPGRASPSPSPWALDYIAIVVFADSETYSSQGKLTKEKKATDCTKS